MIFHFKHMISVVLENKISFANCRLIGGCLLSIVIAWQLIFLKVLRSTSQTLVSKIIVQRCDVRALLQCFQDICESRVLQEINGC